MRQTASVEPETAEYELSTAALVFPQGLVGCEDWKHFVLITSEEVVLPLARLQSLDDPNIALIITDPAAVTPGYNAMLSASDRADLGMDESTKPVVYCTLTVQSDGLLTANLLGPLVLNPTNRRGKQVVLTDSSYSTKHPIAQLTLEGESECSS